MNSVLWLSWALFLTIAVSATRNPYYLSLAALAVTAVWLAVDTLRPLGRPAPRFPLITGGVLLLWSTLVNSLLAHLGDRVLFVLPPWPVIGGPITLNAMLYGFLTGLALSTILTAMSVLHAALNRHEALRLVPPQQRVLALTVATVLNALPSLAHAARDSYEALQIRAPNLHSLARLRVILLALLNRGADYSLALAEVLEVRGFGAKRESSPQRLLHALLFVSSGFTLVLGSLSGYGLILAGGLGLFVLALTLLVWQTWVNLRTLPWPWYSWAFVASLIAAGVLFTHSLHSPRVDLGYAPYPALRWPGFSALTGLAYLVLGLPALTLLVRQR